MPLAVVGVAGVKVGGGLRGRSMFAVAALSSASVASPGLMIGSQPSRTYRRRPAASSSAKSVPRRPTAPGRSSASRWKTKPPEVRPSETRSSTRRVPRGYFAAISDRTAAGPLTGPPADMSSHSTSEAQAEATASASTMPSNVERSSASHEVAAAALSDTGGARGAPHCRVGIDGSGGSLAPSGLPAVDARQSDALWQQPPRP
mmetsp:Transcript_20560/g.66296  ORF Transcript_20560/g.66296 Transcript_20560/m.66296 type:complete len:203 (-) Transcript_20560:247-855(-)